MHILAEIFFCATNFESESSRRIYKVQRVKYQQTMTELVSKQGLLGYVWLAANYEKKLTKQQLLGTSITQSSNLISTGDDITLRLSGQLLLGIVRIYSRKTKYLLDDVNDILLKLKTSFKFATGVQLGLEGINLNIQDSIIKNVKSITLQDQVTRFDLLYQDPLNLDDDFPTSSGIFSQVNASSLEDSFDQSIEFGRFQEPYDPATPGNDLGLELDFDLGGSDHESSVDSIEFGRNVSHVEEHDISMLPELKIDEAPELEVDYFSPVQSNEPATPRISRNRITEEGELLTTKRKLVIDSQEDLDGIPIQTLRDNQSSLLNSVEQVHQLSESEKLAMIYESSVPLKRRKVWDMIDHERAIELARQENELEHFDSFDDNLDFDLSLPDFDNTEDDFQRSLTEKMIEEAEEEEEVEEEEDEGVTVKSTIQIAGHIRDIIVTTGTTNLAELMERDLTISGPLGKVNNRVNKRKEASKCFFELLVLATNDCVGLQQESQENNIGGDIEVHPRDKIFSNFL